LKMIQINRSNVRVCWFVCEQRRFDVPPMISLLNTGHSRAQQSRATHTRIELTRRSTESKSEREAWSGSARKTRGSPWVKNKNR